MQDIHVTSPIFILFNELSPIAALVIGGKSVYGGKRGKADDIFIRPSKKKPSIDMSGGTGNN